MCFSCGKVEFILKVNTRIESFAYIKFSLYYITKFQANLFFDIKKVLHIITYIILFYKIYSKSSSGLPP